MSALQFVHSYLTNRMQRTKINSYGSWEEIMFGVPQGAILGPLLFNIFLCDLMWFLIVENIEIASYVDDSTPYTTGNSIEEVIQKLGNPAKALLQWFTDNQMKANPDKSHFLCSSNNDASLTIENQKITKSEFGKLLGLRLKNLCQKSGQKLNGNI